jgi:RND family efflux transporter MFP subunit
LLSACSKPAPVADAPREVVVLQAQERGSTRPLQSRYVTSLSFRVAGQLVERRVHLGDSVRKGQVLARLDPLTPTRMPPRPAPNWTARQHLEAAQKQLQRDTAQAAEQLISAQQLEQSQDAHAAALAQFKAAQARASVAGNQRDYTTLVAQHDGVISAEQANTGDVLSAGQPVYSLAWSGRCGHRCRGPPPGRPAACAAEVTLAALPGKTYKGAVREVSPAADPQSRTFRIKVTLEQPDASVRLGMTGCASPRPMPRRARCCCCRPPPVPPGRQAGGMDRGPRASWNCAGDSPMASAASAGVARTRWWCRACIPSPWVRRSSRWRRCMPRTSPYERARPFQSLRLDAAAPGAGDLHPGAGDAAGHGS